MNEVEYLQASKEFLAGGDMHTDKVHAAEIDHMMSAAKVASDWCDRVKRGLFYGADIKLRSSPASMTSLTHHPELKDLIHGIIGIFGEAGEMLEHLHQVMLGAAELDPVNLLEELGDMSWYQACVHRHLKTLPSQAYRVNIAKLDKRYPGRSWTAQAALNRDLEAERAVLEEGAASTGAAEG